MGNANNVPLQLTSFIGREREIADLQAMIPATHLLTVTGPGGSGKTRLALEVARAAADSFRDGVWFISIAPLRDPNNLPILISHTLRLPPSRGQAALDSLLDALAPKQLLIVLDNCEHLVGDTAHLILQMVSRAPALHILATTREPFAIEGERVYRLFGLDLPPPNAGFSENAQELLQYEAVHLFVERARARVSSFTLTAANAPSVVEICRRLDGLPLALELASARCNILTPRQIAERLDDRFNLLNAKHRGGQYPHHRNLLAAMDWSYELLTPAEQSVFRRLSVFAGGFSLETALAVRAESEIKEFQVIELLSSLVDKSLLQAQTTPDEQTRYSMLETIREYAKQQLIAASEWSAARDRHLQCFLALVEETAPKILEQDQQAPLDLLQKECDNVRLALAWSLETGAVEAGLRIAVGLEEFWQRRGSVQEALDWLERLFDQAEEQVPRALRMVALAHAAYLAMLMGNTAATIEYGRAASSLGEAIGEDDRSDLAVALIGLAGSLRAAGDFSTSYKVGEQSIELLRGANEEYRLGRVLIMQAGTAMALEKFDVVNLLLDEALSLAREAGDSYRIALILNFRGDVARCEQDYAGAKGDYEYSIARFRELGAKRDLASALQNLGHACLHLGDATRAQALFIESLMLQQEERNRPGMAECLIGFAGIALVRNLTGLAVRLLSAAMALGGPRPANIWTATLREYEYYLARARKKLAESECQAEMSAGRALEMDQAVELALRIPKALGEAKNSADDLTRREREIAIEIAQGKSNGEIAGELVLSKRTVEKHVANIMSKLGVTNRAQIVSWVITTALKLPE